MFTYGGSMRNHKYACNRLARAASELVINILIHDAISDIHRLCILGKQAPRVTVYPYQKSAPSVPDAQPFRYGFLPCRKSYLLWTPLARWRALGLCIIQKQNELSP
jgi:hypothetical protein